MSAWRPIATAPKDGHVLLFSPDARAPGVFIGSLATFEESGGPESYWIDSWTEVVSDADPTHWMPLPNAPETSA